jgi:RimJ/RimL family protein N-acetyltransferase
MHVVTSRLSIEPLTTADIPTFVAYRQRADVARFQSWTPDFSVQQARHLVASQPTGLPPTGLPPEGTWLQLAMHARDDGRLVGDLAVHRLADQPDTFELGVTVGEQRLGFATEGLGALIAELFTRDAHRVVAFCDARNTAVSALLARVGLRHESRQIDADWFKAEWTTLDGWAQLSTDRPRAPDDVRGRG